MSDAIEIVPVPDVPAPRARLCWQQDPVTLVRCDRKKHGPDVAHTWEMIRKPA